MARGKLGKKAALDYKMKVGAIQRLQGRARVRGARKETALRRLKVALTADAQNDTGDKGEFDYMRNTAAAPSNRPLNQQPPSLAVILTKHTNLQPHSTTFNTTTNHPHQTPTRCFTAAPGGGAVKGSERCPSGV
jgi:hypothetical protein